MTHTENIWTIRYISTRIWLRQILNLIKTSTFKVVLVDCGFQFGRLLGESNQSVYINGEKFNLFQLRDRVEIVDWEEYQHWLQEYNESIDCIIYSNFGILNLDNSTKQNHLATIKKRPELVVIGVLDLGR